MTEKKKKKKKDKRKKAVSASRTNFLPRLGKCKQEKEKGKREIPTAQPDNPGLGTSGTFQTGGKRGKKKEGERKRLARVRMISFHKLLRNHWNAKLMQDGKKKRKKRKGKEKRLGKIENIHHPHVDKHDGAFHFSRRKERGRKGEERLCEVITLSVCGITRDL